MSQWDLAVALGVTNGAISQWETGRTKPRRSSAQRLDETLEAEGEILNAYGYAAGATRLDELVQLRARVDQLEWAVTELAKHVSGDVDPAAIGVLASGVESWPSADVTATA